MKESEERGFEQLVGLTIEKVDQLAINSVTFYTTCGKVFTLQADTLHLGIPIICCEEDQ